MKQVTIRYLQDDDCYQLLFRSSESEDWKLFLISILLEIYFMEVESMKGKYNCLKDIDYKSSICLKELSLEEFWNSTEKLTIWCNTEDKANALLQKFNEHGWKWNRNHFHETVCYDNTNGHSSIEYYLQSGYTIIPFDCIVDFH